MRLAPQCRTGRSVFGGVMPRRHRAAETTSGVAFYFRLSASVWVWPSSDADSVMVPQSAEIGPWNSI